MKKKSVYDNLSSLIILIDEKLFDGFLGSIKENQYTKNESDYYIEYTAPKTLGHPSVLIPIFSTEQTTKPPHRTLAQLLAKVLKIADVDNRPIIIKGDAVILDYLRGIFFSERVSKDRQMVYIHPTIKEGEEVLDDDFLLINQLVAAGSSTVGPQDGAAFLSLDLVEPDQDIYSYLKGLDYQTPVGSVISDVPHHLFVLKDLVEGSYPVSKSESANAAERHYKYMVSVMDSLITTRQFSAANLWCRNNECLAKLLWRIVPFYIKDDEVYILDAKDGNWFFSMDVAQGFFNLDYLSQRGFTQIAEFVLEDFLIPSWLLPVELHPLLKRQRTFANYVMLSAGSREELEQLSLISEREIPAVMRWVENNHLDQLQFESVPSTEGDLMACTLPLQIPTEELDFFMPRFKEVTWIKLSSITIHPDKQLAKDVNAIMTRPITYYTNGE